MRPQNIVLRERERVPKAIVHVGLRGEVHDGVYLLLLQHIVDQVRGADVPFHELVVFVVLDLIEVFEARAVIQSIEIHLLSGGW